MVWIYGGGLRAGTNASPIYDCTEMILTSLQLNKPFIAVAINYRVNYFGFLASKELVLDAQEYALSARNQQQRHWYDGSVGNWGLLDQILGLEWIRDHISAFAGDSERVTVMGESAGAVSISSLMVIPQAHGLFHRVILQSGAAGTAPTLRVEDEGQAIFDHLCFRFGVGMELDPLEKVRRLRGLPAKQFAEELNLLALFFNPTLDGVVFEEDCRTLVKDPRAYDPKLNWVVTGTCNDEGTVFAPMFGASTLDAFPAFKSRFCPPQDYAHFDKIFGIPETDLDAERISARLIGNGQFKFPSLQVSETAVGGGLSGCQLTRYHFDTQIPTQPQQEEQGEQGGGGGGKQQPVDLGAHHGIDMFFTFGGPVAKAVLHSEKEQAMIRQVQAVWIEVITASSPQSSPLPKISASLLDSSKKDAIVFGRDMEVHQGVAERMPEEEIEFWRQSEAFALEQAEKGHGRDVSFKVAIGLLTSAP
ncbi:hypothetical protein BGZ95_006393 [Linnemannia exigua]|uniref:Carboxylesterase type B domain-containing protein n=1 Tax=Linnemannia exigua TaxID=604196 RepID=A0AAD4DG04_9FUNG|nr:hypothetical protein BGZ95_006393 [Linnemannia exigua]